MTSYQLGPLRMRTSDGCRRSAGREHRAQIRVSRHPLYILSSKDPNRMMQALQDALADAPLVQSALVGLAIADLTTECWPITHATSQHVTTICRRALAGHCGGVQDGVRSELIRRGSRGCRHCEGERQAEACAGGHWLFGHSMISTSECATAYPLPAAPAHCMRC